ncbi:MAG: hypothetical protein Q9219_000302 [cf. Caloplaca sp. 3 TL-2023]
MDHATFHIVYVDKRVSARLDGKYLHEVPRDQRAAEKASIPWTGQPSDCFQLISPEIAEVRESLGNLLSSFRGGNVQRLSFGLGGTPADLLELEINETTIHPTLVLLESATALETQWNDSEAADGHRGSLPSAQPPTSPSMPVAAAPSSAATQDQNLLRTISSLIARSTLSSFVIPFAFVHSAADDAQSKDSRYSSRDNPLVPPQMLRCLDEGVADVFVSPLSLDCIRSLVSHAYRARKGRSNQNSVHHDVKKARKKSWVGIDERKPYAYLREEMVSGLMTGICSPHDAQSTVRSNLTTADLAEDPALIRAFTSWNFSAHEFSEDQLVHAAFLMLQHALNMTELEKWRLPAGESTNHWHPSQWLPCQVLITDGKRAADLKTFLLASRAAYNSFVHYHNFRHVVDVMQAVFYFLLRIGTLPPYPQTVVPSQDQPSPRSPIANLLQPFDALTLLISAIGHDVGHPGVNNAFLVALNAPLAQLYNDKSVLESFHCAAYSQILRRYWQSAFEDTALRGLMINSVLATDMGLHFKYMADLGNLQEKIYHNKGTQGWSTQVLDEYRTLTCGLLIKCADISNVARPFSVAATWADILQLEFANQGAMENDLGMASTLFGGPPELGDLVKLANSQNGFMNIFARPLFEAVTDILPGMAFAVDEMTANQEIWRQKAQERSLSQENKQSQSSESFLSPRSGSPSRSSSQPELSHPEGLPASQISSRILTSINSANISESGEPRRASAALAQFPSADSLGQDCGTDTRRSSLGAHPGYSGTVVDANPSSRGPSGAFLAGLNRPALLPKRRSSTTSPSQLQLVLDIGPDPQPYPTAATAENIQPSRRGSESTQANASTVASDTGSRNVPVLGGGAGTARKGSKSSDGDQTFGQQRAMAYAMARHSPYSTHDRHSSGGHTSRSQSVPYSPTETQATSVTEDSDDRSQRIHERRGSKTVQGGVPEILDVEKPGSGHRPTGSSALNHSKGPDVKTTVVNGGHHSYADRSVTRKSSRFLNFWKKRGKMVEPGS